MKRTYIIKLISGLFALSVLAVPFTGCEKAPSSSVTSGDSGEESVVVTEAAEPETSEPEDDNLKITEILPDHEYENVDHVELCGGKYYIYERMSEAEEKEVSVIASASTGEVKDLDISDAGYPTFSTPHSEKRSLHWYTATKRTFSICALSILLPERNPPTKLLKKKHTFLFSEMLEATNLLLCAYTIPKPARIFHLTGSKAVT